MFNFCIYNRSIGVFIYKVESYDNFSIYIFSDINECNNFVDAEIDAEMKIYADPSKDQELSELAYKKFFAGTYSSSALTFEIFAYEFESDSMAKQYFKNITGLEQEKNSTFSGVKGTLEYRLVVISNEKAYSVYTESKNAEKLMEILANTFTDQIYE